MAKVKLNMPAINRLDANAIKALKMAADATLGEIVNAGVIPFDVGTMQNDQTFVDDTAANQGRISIVTSAPQAVRLYFHPEYNFQTANNANAQAYWFEPWINGQHKDFARNAFAAFSRKLNGG